MSVKHQRRWALLDLEHHYDRYSVYEQVAVRWLVPGEPMPRPERADELLIVSSDGLVRILRQVGRTYGGTTRHD